MERTLLIAALLSALCWTTSLADPAVPTGLRSPPNEPADFAGTWAAEDVAIRSSDCPAHLTDGVRAQIAGGGWECTFTIRPELLTASLIQECPDDIFEYSADYESGRLHRLARTRLVGSRCDGVFTNTLDIDLTSSPAAITIGYNFVFNPECRAAGCSIVIAGHLRRVELADGIEGRHE